MAWLGWKVRQIGDEAIVALVTVWRNETTTNVSTDTRMLMSDAIEFWRLVAMEWHLRQSCFDLQTVHTANNQEINLNRPRSHYGQPCLFVTQVFHFDCRTDLCGRTLRFAWAASSMLSSRKTISSHRCGLHYAHFTWKLLLAVHICIRIGQHDIGICRKQSARFISFAWFS